MDADVPLSGALHAAARRAGATGSALAEDLGRLLVFAAVYPPDHVRVTTLAAPLAESIARRASDEAPCVVALSEEGLEVDGEPVPASTVAIRHLRRDIELLSVYQVEFFRTVTPSDLIEFASKVRSTTRRETSRRTFEEPCLQGLPPSIAARFDDFGSPVFGTEAEGRTWCGETLEPPDAAPPQDPADAAPEDWRRLTRLLVTELLTVVDQGEAGATPGGAAGTDAGATTAPGAKQDAPPSSAAGDAADATTRAPEGADGDGRSGRPRGARDAVRGEPSGARGGPTGPFGGLLGRAGPRDAAAEAEGRPPEDGSPVIPGWLDDILRPDGPGGPGADAPVAGTGGTAAGTGATAAGTGRDGARAGRSAGRKQSGPNVPGIAPEDGRRARGSRERIRALEEAVRRAVERAIAAGRDVRSVTRIVAETRRLLPTMAPDLPLEQVLEGLREALDEHLRDAFRTEGGASFDGARQPAREPVRCHLTLPELLERVAAVRRRADPRPAERAVDGPEQLSVLLHLLEEERRPGVADGITRRLFARLSRALEADETTVMVGWIDSLCAPGRPTALVDRLLPLLFEQLRRAAPACTIAVLLRAFHGARPPVVRALWPHLALELLHGLDGAANDVREEAVVVTSEVPSAMLESEAGRFAALVSLHLGPHSSRFLDPPRRKLTALYEVLLDLREAPHLAQAVVEGYRRAPPPTSAARALVAVDTESSARTFLRRVLREERDGGESESLRRMGASIVAAALHGLTRAGRREPWVAEAIRALVALRSPLAVEVLEEVLRTRRLLVLRQWPLACRRAAQSVRASFALADAEAHAAGAGTGAR